jgi:putative ABC transport system permease protein
MMWFQRTGARLFLVFALIALILSAVGVYGVKAYLVARQTRELGIRMALGATRWQILWQVLREGLGTTALGLGAGLVLALAVGRWLSHWLYEVNGADPLTFLVTVVVLGGAALLASYFPARRAAAVQPMEALRDE